MTDYTPKKYTPKYTKASSPEKREGVDIEKELSEKLRRYQDLKKESEEVDFIWINDP